MKITCEHCGAMIDTDYEKKCSNCSAPYSNNKEYKRKKELEEKERQAKLRTHEIGNEIAEETFKRFKRINHVSPIIITIVFAVTAFIFFLVFKQISGFDTGNSNSNNVNNNYDNEFDKSAFNVPIEMYGGEQNGFYVKSMIDYIILSNTKYKSHIILLNYNNNSGSSSEEILGIKSKISNDKSYYILFTYDSNGYINKIDIKD